jgi:hypothetical protein
MFCRKFRRFATAPFLYQTIARGHDAPSAFDLGIVIPSVKRGICFALASNAAAQSGSFVAALLRMTPKTPHATFLSVMTDELNWETSLNDGDPELGDKSALRSS